MLESFFQNVLITAETAGDQSPALLFLLLVFGTFASEDLACVTAGSLAASGRVGFSTAACACFLGILIGDIMLYGAGRLAGERLIRTKLFRRFVSAEALAKAKDWLERRGASAVFVSRFVSGLRLPTYFAAGALRTDFRKFLLYFTLAALLWTPLIVGLAAAAQTAIAGNLIFAIISALLIVKLGFSISDRKRRRLLYGKLKRVLDWEFWPLQIFYFPVVVYVLYLAVRFRGISIFTAVNPGIPAGGFVGESKDEIYRLIERSPASGPYMLARLLISAEMSHTQKLDASRAFISRNDIGFPVVAKPDRGERGKGVAIVYSFEELDRYLSDSAEDTILQEFSRGEEVSIFYARFPNDDKGKIFSITEKRFPELAGDGISNIETLILRDERAVCMARSYFAHNRDQLKHVPALGEKVRLIDIGTHSRGAVFLDGGWILTRKLEDKLDEICRGIDGFDFGRFDIRARSFDDLRNGENFKIIELNGVTSESTNIYDPRYNLLDAYRILFRQWKLAFRIGAENTKLGARTTSLLELAKLIIYRKRKPSATGRHQSKVSDGPSTVCV
jgi:membrane protein DedA with SNARE-associated domain